MTLEPDDPLLATLAGLTVPATTPARDARVRARCHATLTASRRPRPVARVIDRLLPVAVVVYAVATVFEGLRLAGII
jgi:hypothetical protein